MTQRRGIQAIRHDVIANRSDHDAILVEVRVVNGGNAVRVKGGSWNIGPGSMRDLGELLDLLGPRGFLCLQEAGGQLDAIRGEARRHRYGLLGSTRVRGAASTFVLTGPELDTRRTVVHSLLGREYVGPGAGPDHNKPKVANGGRVSCDGVVFGVFSAHQLASLQNPLRERHGIEWVDELTDVTFPKRVPWIVGADWNADFRKPGHPVVKHLHRRGWTTNQDQLGDLATHGRRAIDALAWRASDNIPPPPKKEPKS